MSVNIIGRNITGNNGLEFISRNEIGLKVDGVSLYINENGELAAHLETDPPVVGTTYRLEYTLEPQIDVAPPAPITDIVLNDSPIADVIEDGFASGDILNYSGTTIKVNTSSLNLIGRDMNLKLEYRGTITALSSTGMTSYVTKNNESASKITGTPIYAYNIPTDVVINFPFTCDGSPLELNMYVDGNAQMISPVPDRYTIENMKITLHRI